MDKNEHAFKELDFITTTFGDNVMRIEEVTDKGYRTDSREFPFISFLEESAFRKVNVGPYILETYQEGDNLRYDKGNGHLFNQSQLDRLSKPRKKTKMIPLEDVVAYLRENLVQTDVNDRGETGVYVFNASTVDEVIEEFLYDFEYKQKMV